MEIGGRQAVAAGRVSKTFGLNGELVISLYDTFTYENNGEPVYFQLEGIWTPLFFASLRRRGQSKAVVVFDDMETEFRASELVGKEFFGRLDPKEQRKKENKEKDEELYLEDLIGYAVRLAGQKESGQITGFIENEFNPLFEITWNDSELLIPAADDFIVRIDEKSRTIEMELPEGLLDL